MTSWITTFDLNIAAQTLAQWVVQSVIFGTLLAIATWSLLQLVRRRGGHTIHGLFWLIVLLKFIIPVGPGWSLSMASGVAFVHDFSTSLAQQIAPKSAVPTPESAIAGDSPVVPILVLLHGATQPTALAATTDVRPALPVALILSGAYLLGVVVVGSRRVWHHRRFAARCGRLPPADDATRAVVEAACHRLGQGRVPMVRIGDDVPAPFILGALRPTLVLPSRQLETPAELQAVVLHEIAHLRRGDLFVRYLQWITGTLLFFWPVVAWVNRRIDLARESACDAWALRHGQLTEGEYARCLLRALRSLQRPRPAIGIAAMAANKRNVERRIEMILDQSARSRPRRWLALPVAALLVAWATFVLTGSADARVAPNEKNLSSDDGTAAEKNIWVEHRGADAGGTTSFTIKCDPSDDDGAVFIVGPHAGITHDFHKGMFIADSEDGTPGGHASYVVMAMGAGPSGEQLAEFAASHPTADADGDGNVSKVEHDAYLVALAMAQPGAVIDQFSGADQNGDGQLDATEAADLVSHCVSFGHGNDLHFGHDDVDHTSEVFAVEIEAIASTELDPKSDDTELHSHVECDIKIEADSDEGHTVYTVPRITLKDRRGDDKSGPVMITGPAMNQWVSIPDAAGWLLDNVSATPTAAEVAGYIPAVRNAPLSRFLRMHPDADTDGDGALTETERDSFLQAKIAQIHAKLAGEHPDADANGDGSWVSKEGDAPFGEQCLFIRADGHTIVELDKGEGNQPIRTTIELKNTDGEVITIVTDKNGDGAAKEQ